MLKVQEDNIYFFIKEDIYLLLNFIKNSNGPLQFKEFKTLTNPVTKKKFSTSTLSIKLKNFEEKGLITKQIIEKKTPTVIVYLLTEKGNKTLNILKETEDNYKKLKE